MFYLDEYVGQADVLISMKSYESPILSNLRAVLHPTLYTCLPQYSSYFLDPLIQCLAILMPSDRDGNRNPILLHLHISPYILFPTLFQPTT